MEQDINQQILHTIKKLAKKNLKFIYLLCYVKFYVIKTVQLQRGKIRSQKYEKYCECLEGKM